MARKGRRRLLPFRVPFFRIFYSTTYTIVLIITLCFLAITPGSAILEAIEADALQYVFIISGVYVGTAIVALFIYSSRLYTNRIVLAAVGKPYIPVEADEIGKKIRAMIVAQLQRSAIISLEAKPRDLRGEVRDAEQDETLSVQDGDTIGTIVPVNVDNPPWGDVQHRGWTAPSAAAADYPGNLQFDVVIAELPHLLEARAVSLAPASHDLRADKAARLTPDPRVVEILRRQEKAGLREYLTQLSYLGLIELNGSGATFIDLYERARFSGLPATIDDFKSLMSSFATVMDGMSFLDPAIITEIRRQVQPAMIEPLSLASLDDFEPFNKSEKIADIDSHTSIEDTTPVTARTRHVMPYMSHDNDSHETMNSVLVDGRSSTPHAETNHGPPRYNDIDQATASSSLDSDVGSVVRHDVA